MERRKQRGGDREGARERERERERERFMVNYQLTLYTANGILLNGSDSERALSIIFLFIDQKSSNLSAKKTCKKTPN